MQPLFTLFAKAYSTTIVFRAILNINKQYYIVLIENVCYRPRGYRIFICNWHFKFGKHITL